MLRTVLAGLAGVVALASVATAEETGRYTLSPTADGFVRLDSETGVVSFCKAEGDSLACKAGADDVAKLTTEIERLTDENKALREELEQARQAAAVAQPPSSGLPSDAEIDKAMSFVEKLVRRFKALVDDLNRTDDGSTTPL